MPRETFNILSIDGGGLRGVYAVAILAQMQEEMGIDFSETFDLIAGTSTGAIIASGLAMGISANTILEMYQEQGAFIFKKNFWGGIITPRYNRKYLEQVLGTIFGDQTFKDTKTRLMVTATNISDGMPWVFKSGYNERLTRDRDVKITDAVLASCSAPLYFNPYGHDEGLLVDGGLWANNPAMAALVEALGHNIDIKRYKVRLLSIGTGINVKYYPLEWVEKQWGVSRWGMGLIEVILNMQAFSIEKYLGTIMNPEHYLRLNFELEDKMEIDDISVMDTLIEKGRQDFYKNSGRIYHLFKK